MEYLKSRAANASHNPLSNQRDLNPLTYRTCPDGTFRSFFATPREADQQAGRLASVPSDERYSGHTFTGAAESGSVELNLRDDHARKPVPDRSAAV